MQQIEIKLIIKYKKIIIIESFVFNILINTRKRKYIIIEKLIIVYDIAT